MSSEIPLRRLRRLLSICLLVGLAASALALLGLGMTGTPLRLHLVLSLTVAITGSLLLAGGLMGLLFESSRSGHDEEVADAGPEMGPTAGRSD